MTRSPGIRTPVVALVLCLAAGCGSSSTPTAGGSTAPSASPAPAATSSPSPAATSSPLPAATSSPSPAGTAPTAGPGPTPTGPVEVPSRVLQTRPAVPLTSPAAFGTGVRAQVTAVRAVTSAGTGAGQVAGAPAVAFSISLVNGSTVPVSLAATNVALSYGAAADPGLPVGGAPATVFSGVLAPGGTASAVYVFAVPPDRRGTVALTVSYAAGAPVVLLTGAAPS